VIYPLVIRWFAEKRVALEGETVKFDGKPMSREQRQYRPVPEQQVK